MKILPTWSGRSSFQYSGSVKEGTQIFFGSGHRVTISADKYHRLLNEFSGRTVNIGTSRTEPPVGSLGYWIMQNFRTCAIASYLGPILIHEGYADKADGAEIRVTGYEGIK